MSKDNQIDLVEFPASSAVELKAAQDFYGKAFGWSFRDWGGEYIDTEDSGVPSGINAADQSARPVKPLAVIYAKDLEAAKAKVSQSGGVITKDIFSFPGGRRFHFTDPAGNELAVWSE